MLRMCEYNNNIASVGESTPRHSGRITTRPQLFSDEQSNYQNVQQ